MSDFPKKRTDENPWRAGAIILTEQGMIIEKDRKDKHIEENLRQLRREEEKLTPEKATEETLYFLHQVIEDFSTGRYSLPGGKLEEVDYKKARARGIMDMPRKEMTEREYRMFEDVGREAAIREVGEELGLKINRNSARRAKEINGKDRNHLIYLLHVTGLNRRIRIFPDEIEGVGFLQRDDGMSVLSMEGCYVQHHLIEIARDFMNTKEALRLARSYQSEISVDSHLVQDWLGTLGNIYGFRYLRAEEKSRYRIPTPQKLISSPVFSILRVDVHNNKTKRVIVDFRDPPSFTRGKKSVFIPRDAEPPEKISRRKRRKKKSHCMRSPVLDREIPEQSEILRKESPAIPQIAQEAHAGISTALTIESTGPRTALWAVLSNDRSNFICTPDGEINFKPDKNE